MRNVRTLLPWMLTSLLTAAAAVHAQTRVPVPPPPSVVGAYEVRIGGYYTGTGTAAVGSVVNINVPRIEGEGGETGTLVVTNLELRNGRFRGTGTIAGRTITIAGRVDPPDGRVLKTARLSATFIISGEERGGRIIGHRIGESPPPPPP
jgi:hypothetical protein